MTDNDGLIRFMMTPFVMGCIDCVELAFQAVTGIGYLPQVTTCGNENQDLRAAKMHKTILHEKKRHFGNEVRRQCLLCSVLTKRHFALRCGTKRVFAMTLFVSITLRTAF
jgi:hypothetical protein